ncbi:MAG: mandelate racemase/muconate lactonizing enzyme family protein [Burkholderiales bacterium]|nr:mandelate racemase/muconate lactonizing enzyme family protein [Burkholderiales bacterium]
MKIIRVEPILVRTPMALDDSVPHAGGAPKTDVHTVLVKVETDEGITGWGEAFANAGWQSTLSALAQLVGPRVLGKDPSNIAQIQADLHRSLYNTGRSGPTVFAVSGLDIALWDIAAKRASMPLYKLLGGSARTTLPAYASLLRYGEAAVVERKTREAIERGYRFVKLHENKRDCISAAKRACGSEVPLMVDCSCPWTVDEAIAAARELADQDLAWLEEPIYPPDDHAGLARLRALAPMPIAAGENCSNLMEFKRMMEVGAIGIAQPSITKIGGISEIRKVFALGEAHGVTVVPHSPYFGPGLMASIHVCAAAAREIPVERYYCDFAATPFSDQIDPKDGAFAIPQEPGLGRDPDERLVARMRVG